MALKLKKTELVAAYEELDKVVGLDQPISTKLSIPKFAKELHVTVFGTGEFDKEAKEIDYGVVEEGDEFTDETKEAFALLEKEFGNPRADAEGKKEKPAKEEETEKPKDKKKDKKKGKKEKPAKEDKKKDKKKGKKEKPAKEEETEKPKDKKKDKKKGKAGKSEDLVDLIKSTLKKDVLRGVIEDNKQFDADQSVLLDIKNPMALRKQMLAVLNGEVAVNEPPKPREKKVKVPTLAENIEAATKFKELKALAEGVEEFAGIKMKKFKKDVNGLKKKMLKACPAPKKGGKGSGGKRAPQGEGVIATIRKCAWEAPKKKGISKEEILEVLTAKFPEKNPDSMAKTIQAQLPNRTTKETGKPVEKMENGNYRAGKVKE